MEENKENKREFAQADETVVDQNAAAEESAPETESADEKPCKGEKKKLKKAEAEIAELKKMLEAKEAEAAELNDRYMRLCAEYDNFRKRTAKERENLVSDAACDTLSQILPVLDNLERAAAYNVGDNADSPMGKGLELTLKSFAELLAKLGVTEIAAEGQPFDPNVHNAVMHIEDDTFGEGVVVEVLMKGYAKGDKVLRYSMVKVAN